MAAATHAIRAGDLDGLQRLLADHPGLAVARVGNDRGPHCCTWRPTGPVTSRTAPPRWRRSSEQARTSTPVSSAPTPRRLCTGPRVAMTSRPSTHPRRRCRDRRGRRGHRRWNPTDGRHRIRPVAHGSTPRRTWGPRRPLGGRHPRPARPRPRGLRRFCPTAQDVTGSFWGACHGGRQATAEFCSTTAPTSTGSVGTASPHSIRLSATAPEISPIGCAPAALDPPRNTTTMRKLTARRRSRPRYRVRCRLALVRFCVVSAVWF